MLPIRMMSVVVILVLLEASQSWEQKFAWAKTFIDLAGDLPCIFYTLERLCFVLLAAFKAINTIKFTQLVA